MGNKGKRRYNTRCWLCGSTDLEPDERGIRCHSCGATYNIIPKPGSDPLTEYRDYAAEPKGAGSLKSPSPSGRVVRQAAKAREKI